MVPPSVPRERNVSSDVSVVVDEDPARDGSIEADDTVVDDVDVVVVLVPPFEMRPARWASRRVRSSELRLAMTRCCEARSVDESNGVTIGSRRPPHASLIFKNTGYRAPPIGPSAGTVPVLSSWSFCRWTFSSSFFTCTPMVLSETGRIVLRLKISAIFLFWLAWVAPVVWYVVMYEM